MAGIDMTGKQFGELVVIELAGKNANRQLLWKVHCSCGRERVVRGDHLRSGHTTTCDHAHSPSYYSVHQRLYRNRGLAKDEQCAYEHCFKPAMDWALIGEGELIEKGLKYSEDLDSYAPMCRSHHMLLDKGRAELSLGA